jgi:hypothetical protein
MIENTTIKCAKAKMHLTSKYLLSSNTERRLECLCKKMKGNILVSAREQTFPRVK